MKLRTVGIAVILLIIMGIIIYQLYIPLDRKSSQIKVLQIPKGISAKRIVRLLKEEGLIRSGLTFRILAKIKRIEARLQAGEYELSPAMSLSEIISKIGKGKIVFYFVTIPEGYNVRQIVRVLEKKDLARGKRFIKLTTKPRFISQFNIEAKSLEGYLFPDTYKISKGMREEEIIRLMVSQFNKVIEKKDRKRAAEIGLTFPEIITLASIIDKETSNSQERPLVSAVFHNRLKARRPLQADPTVIYALGETFSGNLRRRHLKVDSPYNTYKYRGLPPGPIGNPGKEAIQAALYPADVDYFYFVSRNDGTHQFSVTLKEHNRAVWKYQKKRIKTNR